MQQGRVQVSCPAVLGDGTLSWAMPCVPYAGAGVGFFAIPPNGANIWVEFEGGDPDYPIWSGCFWGVGEVPAMPTLPQTKMLKTDAITLKLDDLPGIGGVTLRGRPARRTHAAQAGADRQRDRDDERRGQRQADAGQRVHQ